MREKFITLSLINLFLATAILCTAVVSRVSWTQSLAQRQGGARRAPAGEPLDAQLERAVEPTTRQKVFEAKPATAHHAETVGCVWPVAVEVPSSARSLQLIFTCAQKSLPDRKIRAVKNLSNAAEATLFSNATSMLMRTDRIPLTDAVENVFSIETSSGAHRLAVRKH